jgi:SAM-dependent methyltransferase
MVRTYQENDDPLGWFDSIYSDAGGDYRAVFWADLEPSPYLVAWMKEHPIITNSKRAIVIGCGVGDDAEAMAKAGYEVIGFDISPTAIELCKKRYPDTKVTYLVANLFDYPKSWFSSFDLVYECNTIQVLPGAYRVQARDAMVSLLHNNGNILVSCRSRRSGTQEDAIPLPLDRIEIDGFTKVGLKEKSFLAYDDTQTPPVPHFFAVYQK